MKTIATRLAAVSLLATAVAACAAGGPGGPSPSTNPASGAPASQAPIGGVAVPIRAAAVEPQACMDALLSGKLAPNELSGLGVVGADGEAMAVEWPFGYTGRLMEGKLVLLDETGQLVAKVGDEISVGGGFGNQLWHSCAPVTVTQAAP